MLRIARRRLWSALAVALCVGAFAACSNDGADPEAFCARSLDAPRFAETFAEGFDPTDVPGALTSFRAAQGEVQELRDIAPEAVRADIDVLLDFLDQLIAGLEAADPDSDERPAVYDDLRGRADEVAAASGRIEQYVVANCTKTTPP